MQGMTDGAGELAARGYQGLHGKIAELLTDDYYVTDALRLENKLEDEDRRVLSQVQLLASQMVIYLESLARDQNPGVSGWSWSSTGSPPFGAPIPPVPPTPPNPPDWRGFGRDIQDQIINMTRSTLRRAFSNIDFEAAGPIHGADMRGEDLTRRSFHGVRLHGTNLQGANASAGDFAEARLIGCIMIGVNLSRANLTDARLEGCQLHDANFNAANCERTVFVGCDLTRADLRTANFNGARFVNPIFTDAIMPDGQPFNGGDLRKYGAVLVTRRIHVELNDDDNEESPDETRA